MKFKVLAFFLVLTIVLTLGTSCKSSSKNVKDLDGNEQNAVGDSENLGSDSEDVISIDPLTGEEVVVSKGGSQNNGTDVSGGASGSTQNGAAGKFNVKNTKTMPDYVKDLPASTTITVFSASKPSDKIINEQCAAFKALTGKDIKLAYKLCKDWNTMGEELQTLVYANNSPDLFSYDAVKAPYLTKKGIFENLDNYIDVNDPLWKETKTYSCDTYASFDGKRFAVVEKPSPEVNGLIYNKKLVNAAVTKSGGSLKDPVSMFYDGTWTWDALKKFNELITVPGATEPSVFGALINPSKMVSMLASTGTDIVTLKNGKLETNLDNANVLRFYEYCQSLSKIATKTNTYDNMDTQLANGKIGFIAGHPYMFGTGALTKMKKANEAQYVPFPKDSKADKYYSHAGFEFHFIPKGSKNAKAAAAWYYFERYLEYNPNPNIKAKEKEVFKSDMGWTDTDYQYYLTDIAKTVTPLTVIGDRIWNQPDYAIWITGLNDPSRETAANILISLKPAHTAALQKFNDTK